MRFVVTCPECVGRISDYPDREGADGLVRRHHMLVGHTANVERVTLADGFPEWGNA